MKKGEREPERETLLSVDLLQNALNVPEPGTLSDLPMSVAGTQRFDPSFPPASLQQQNAVVGILRQALNPGTPR